MERIKLFRSSIIILIIYIAIVISLALVIDSEARIPTHWNAEGVIDNWASKSTAVSFALGINLFLFLLLYLMPWYSPKYRQNQKGFDIVMPRLTNILLIIMGLINIYGLSWPLGSQKLPGNPIFLMLGLLFVLLGNLLPKLPLNFFVGIRTPWTISDEDNWSQTHRLGAWLYMIGGILMMMLGILPLPTNLMMICIWCIIGVILVPVLYSFILFRRKQK
ncbi:MAG: SdpI family protein [Candidatus Cloacimonetes bacterium]|nr:SdpI family protein [Candidatus Cloacimonadota bacterium]MDK2851186.1 hypothetical protein [Candidatus Cloacimonadota bacterium]